VDEGRRIRETREERETKEDDSDDDGEGFEIFENEKEFWGCLGGLIGLILYSLRDFCCYYGNLRRYLDHQRSYRTPPTNTH
jgi:hypothetical protein